MRITCVCQRCLAVSFCMLPFDFNSPTRIVFGPGRLTELGELARSLGKIERVLVVSDPGIVDAGHAPRGIAALQAAGLHTMLFDRVEENPTTAHVEDGVAVATDYQPDLIIGLGGGSSMDCAKGINFIYSCGGRMQDYWGVGKASGPMRPMIAVPTTAGTGSETQSFALISDAATKAKMACGDKRAAFRIALLDPELTLTQPARVTALTAIDAVSHAIETAVTTRRNPISLAFSREAWHLLSLGLPRVFHEPNDVGLRSAVQLGACFAGLAIENSMLGGAHALANPLTATYGIAHGEAIGLMLPHVIQHNGQHVATLYADLLHATHDENAHVSSDDEIASLVEFVATLRKHAGMPATLHECGVDRERLPVLAAGASEQWTGTFNPVSMTTEDFLKLYEAAY